MFYFHLVRSKQPQIFDFPTLGPAKYLYKMGATAGPICREVGIRFSTQELSCFIGVHYNIVGWEKVDCANASIFHGTPKKLNDNWKKIGLCEPTLISIVASIIKRKFK